MGDFTKKATIECRIRLRIDHKCTKHHYPSPTHKKLKRFVQGSATIALLFFICFRFYLVGLLYHYPPIPEERRNQIVEKESGFMDTVMSLFA